MIPVVNPLRNPIRRARQAKDVPQYFTRNSIAYTSDGEQVAANVVRRERGKFGKAVLIEEGTANLLSSANSQGFTSAVNVTVVNGGTYTVSMTGSGSIVLSGAGTGTVTATALITITASGTTLTLTPTGDTGRVQVEAKAYATTWQIGGMARSPETLTVPTDGVLNPEEGTVEFWWNPQIPASGIVNPRTSPKLLQIGNYYTNGSITFWAYHNVGNEPSLNFYIKGQTNSGWSLTPVVKSSGSGWYHQNEFHRFAVSWVNGNNFKVYMDGLLIGGPYTIADPITSWGGNIMYIGGDNASGTKNSIIDDLRISSIARSDAEIAEAYKSGMPLQADEWTTAIL